VSDQLSSDLASLRINRDAPAPPSTARRLIVPLVIFTAVGAVGIIAWRKLEGELFKAEV
jgi:hypothetical protein